MIFTVELVFKYRKGKLIKVFWEVKNKNKNKKVGTITRVPLNGFVVDTKEIGGCAHCPTFEAAKRELIELTGHDFSQAAFEEI